MIMVASQKEDRDCIYEAAAAATSPSLVFYSNHHHQQLKKCVIIEQQESIRTSSWSSNTTTCLDHDAATSSSSSWLQLGLGLPNSTSTPSPSPSPLPQRGHHMHMLDLHLNLIASNHTTPTNIIPSLSGIWFTLLPSLSRSLQPCLPPLSNRYLRIKDEGMRVGKVIKYVAHKLGLDADEESQISQLTQYIPTYSFLGGPESDRLLLSKFKPDFVEIRCRGQVMKAELTLKQVRDEIWSGRQTEVTLLPNSSTSPHLMILYYSYQPSPSQPFL